MERWGGGPTDVTSPWTHSRGRDSSGLCLPQGRDWFSILYLSQRETRPWSTVTTATPLPLPRSPPSLSVTLRGENLSFLRVRCWANYLPLCSSSAGGTRLAQLPTLQSRAANTRRPSREWVGLFIVGCVGISLHDSNVTAKKQKCHSFKECTFSVVDNFQKRLSFCGTGSQIIQIVNSFKIGKDSTFSWHPYLVFFPRLK